MSPNRGVGFLVLLNQMGAFMHKRAWIFVSGWTGVPKYQWQVLEMPEQGYCAYGTLQIHWFKWAHLCSVSCVTGSPHRCIVQATFRGRFFLNSTVLVIKSFLFYSQFFIFGKYFTNNKYVRIILILRFLVLFNSIKDVVFIPPPNVQKTRLQFDRHLQNGRQQMSWKRVPIHVSRNAQHKTLCIKPA